MAEIIRVSVKESERGRLLCVWMDDGNTTYIPMGPTVEGVLADWAGGELGDDEFLENLDKAVEGSVEKVAQAVNAKLERINRNLSTDGIHVYFDGETFDKVKLDPELEKHLIKLLKERDTEEGLKDFQSWAAFAVNLYGNVTPYIREQLVSWMASQDWMSFTEDGCFIGYRGGQINAETGIAESIHTGPAIVNGVHVNGHVPNPDGGIVEMPRNSVVDDRTRGCESGLHVGTFEYARGWAHDVLMRVKVDPRDVVSVPTDCHDSKIRCCRFEVLDHVNTREPGFEDRVAEWGEEWTYAPSWSVCYPDYLNDPECADFLERFDEVCDELPGSGDADWEMFFNYDAHNDYCHGLVDDGVYCLPEYDDWCRERFDELVYNYINGFMDVDEKGAFERLFGAEDEADEDEADTEWEELDGDEPKDFDDVKDVLETANDVATGLFGNIKTPPRNVPAADDGMTTYRFV